jgi:hypothetical protein
MAMPAIVFQALKQQNPSVPDTSLYESWDTMVDIGRQSGLDLDKMDPYEIVKSFVGKGQPSPQMDPSNNQAAINQVAGVSDKPVAVTEQRMDKSLSPATAPLMLPKQISIQSLTPNLEAAQKDYDARRRTQHQGDIFTGFMSGISGNDQTEATRRKAIQEDDLQRTVTAAKDMFTQQKDSQTGNVAANKAQLEDAKARAELIGVLGNTEVTQELINAKSDSSMAARVTARQQAVAAGYTPEQAIQLIPDSMNGMAAIRATEGIPGALKAQTETIKAQKDAAGIPKERAEGRIATGVANTYAPGSVAPASPTQVNNKIFGEKAPAPGTVPESTDNKGKIALPPGAVPNVSIAGFSTSNPAAAAVSQGAGTAQVEAEAAARNYNTVVKPTIDSVRQTLKGVNPGKFTEITARWTDSDKALLLTQLAQLNAVMPTAFPPAVATAIASMKEGDNFNGTILGNMTGPQIEKLIADAQTRALLGASGARESKQAFEKGNTTPQTQKAAGQDIPTITSQEQYDKLKPGARYKDAAGAIRTKG